MYRFNFFNLQVHFLRIWTEQTWKSSLPGWDICDRFERKLDKSLGESPNEFIETKEDVSLRLILKNWGGNCLFIILFILTCECEIFFEKRANIKRGYGFAIGDQGTTCTLVYCGLKKNLWRAFLLFFFFQLQRKEWIAFKNCICFHFLII